MSPTAAEPRTANVATLGVGPFRGSAAVAAGLITWERLEGQGWRRLMRDVYLNAETPVDHLTRCAAAMLIAPEGSVLGFTSALGIFCPGLMPEATAPVDLIVPARTSLRSRDQVRVHRPRLERSDVTRWGGLPVTTPARTAFDLARGKELVQAVIALDALRNRRMTTAGTIAPYLRRSLPGSARAARALALSSPHAESPMETRTRLLIVLAGLPAPAEQYEVFDDGVFVARLDLAYPGCRLGIEYDGDHHRDRATFRFDAVRANRLRLCGWTVLRFTADDVLRHRDRLLAQVTTALAQRQHRRR
jgi:hypothetical protein